MIWGKIIICESKIKNCSKLNIFRLFFNLNNHKNNKESCSLINKNRLKLKCSVNSTKTYNHTQNTGTVSEERKGREDKCKKGQLRKNFSKFK